MQGNETARNRSNRTVVHHSQHYGATYRKVLDQRKRAIRGLWERNDRYYAQLTIEETNTGLKRVKRVPLEGAQTQAQAVAKLQELLTQRRKGALPVLKRTPKFADYADRYLEYYRQVKDAKRTSTLKTEEYALKQWKAHLGHVRLDRITRALVNSFIARRQAVGRSGRTVNLEVTCFRNVMKRAIDDAWITSLPTQNLRPLKWTPPQRGLYSEAQIKSIAAAAVEESKNGQEFADYLLLLAYSGARMSEALRLKWADVDWERKQLTIGADGLAKNYKVRVVDFNARLEAHLGELQRRRAPDTVWLFPSPQRGRTDRPSKTFRETLLLARERVKLTRFAFHDCRHFFISMCVMSGIDYMTIARWVGHQDGGVLIGRVYGHLSNEHAQRQAQRVNFGPVVLDTADAA